MLLAIDTSTRSIGIAILDGSRILCEEIWISRNFHTVDLAKAVDKNLSRSGLSPQDLDVLGVAIGPGSFTGLRIGLALVKGIAYTHQLPVIGIPTLDVTARGITPTDMLLAALLQAGRGRYAVAWYRVEDGSWKSQDKIENLTEDELLKKVKEPCLLTGEISPDFRQRIADNKHLQPVEPTQAIRSPRYLAVLAWERWKTGSVDDVISLSPIYLHKGEPIPG
jgi:tRNA threonylcarbamoyladenosine biosynthesis protein TsaB